MNSGRTAYGIVCLMSALVSGAAITFIDADTEKGRIDRLVVTPEGTPWVLVETPRVEQNYSAFRLLCWDGQALRAPVPEVRLVGAVYSASFFGGSDRDAWLAFMPDRALSGQGRLLKLGKGTIEASDSFRKASAGRDSEIYVARDGRVFNWGESFLACRQTNGVWTRAEAALPLNHQAVLPAIVEREGEICFFVSPMLYRVGPDGSVSGQRVPGAPAGDRNAYAHRWGSNRIAVWPGGFGQPVNAFDIATLQRVTWPAELTELRVWGATAFSTRDGTLWLSRIEDQAPSTVLLRPDVLRPVVWRDVPFPAARVGPGGGATVFECADGTVASGLEGLMLIAPDGKTKRLGWEYGLNGSSSDLQEDREKRLWFVNDGRAVIFNRGLPLGEGAGKTRWEEVAVNGDTWLFQPQPGEIACFAKNEPVLLRWNGREWRRQALPFDPYGYKLHRTDDRGVIWVGRTAGSPWYRIDSEGVRSLPDEASAKAAALAEGARRFVGNCGAASEITNDPAFSGGFFHYAKRADGSFDRAPAVRTFEGHRITVGMAGTPFVNDYLMRVCEDGAGNLWALVSPPHEVRPFKSPTGEIGVMSQRVRLFRYTPDSRELAFAAPAPATCGRSLVLPLKPGAAPRQRVLFSRVEEMPWERFGDGAPHACFRFPTNGVYHCQVIAFDHGGKIPADVSFTVTAGMELPETQRDGPETAEPVWVTAHPWYPPAHAVPTIGGGAVRLLWKAAGEEAWHPLDPVCGLSVAALRRGKQTLLFSAEEEGFWRDPTPLRLEACLTLSLDDYLACLIEGLSSADPSVRVRAKQALGDCLPEAHERIAELERMAGRGDRIREGLRVLSSRPQKIPNPSSLLRLKKGGQE